MNTKKLLNIVTRMKEANTDDLKTRYKISGFEIDELVMLFKMLHDEFGKTFYLVENRPSENLEWCYDGDGRLRIVEAEYFNEHNLEANGLGLLLWCEDKLEYKVMDEEFDFFSEYRWAVKALKHGTNYVFSSLWSNGCPIALNAFKELIKIETGKNCYFFIHDEQAANETGVKNSDSNLWIVEEEAAKAFGLEYDSLGQFFDGEAKRYNESINMKKANHGFVSSVIAKDYGRFTQEYENNGYCQINEDWSLDELYGEDLKRLGELFYDFGVDEAGVLWAFNKKTSAETEVLVPGICSTSPGEIEEDYNIDWYSDHNLNESYYSGDGVLVFLNQWGDCEVFHDYSCYPEEDENPAYWS